MNSDPWRESLPTSVTQLSLEQGDGRESCVAMETVPSPRTDLPKRFRDTESAALIFQTEGPHCTPKLGDLRAVSGASLPQGGLRGIEGGSLPLFPRCMCMSGAGCVLGWLGCSLDLASHICPQEAEASWTPLQTPCLGSIGPEVPEPG